VRNANNTASVSHAIKRAKRSFKPTVIECSSIIGYGSRFQNTNAVHGSPLNQDQIAEVRDFLNYKIPSFTVHPSVYDDMKALHKRGVKAEQNFNIGLQKLENKNLKLYNEFIDISANKLNFDVN
jgi:transketolase